MNSKLLQNLFLSYACIGTQAVFANGEVKIELRRISSVTVPINGGAEIERFNCDFPELTDIRDIAKAYTSFFGKEYAVDENLQMKVRINSPELVTKPEALKLFQKMLTEYGLKTVHSDSVIEIVKK
jgi:hypothetical protein